MAITRMQFMGPLNIAGQLTPVKAGSNVTIQADGTIVIPLGAGENLPAGTKMTFISSAAPVGWTRDTAATHNNSMIRVMATYQGTGGSVDFTTIFSPTSSFSTQTTFTSGQVSSWSVSTAQMGAHSHGLFAINARNQLCVGGGSSTRVDPPVTAATTNTGGNGGHIHSIVGQVGVGNFVTDFNVKYVDCLVASYDG